jgi:mono/diheme cytochrome c family protein
MLQSTIKPDLDQDALFFGMLGSQSDCTLGIEMIRATISSLLLTSLVAAPAIAEDTEVTNAGQALAEHWCAECHLVVAEQPYTWSSGAPTFFEVADDPSVAEASLRAFLATAHATMPNIVLNHQQTDDIICYILSLRSSR